MVNIKHILILLLCILCGCMTAEEKRCRESLKQMQAECKQHEWGEWGKASGSGMYLMCEKCFYTQYFDLSDIPTFKEETNYVHVLSGRDPR